MSRTVIAAVVAVVIAGLTTVALLLTSSGFDERTRKDADRQVRRAVELLQRNKLLERISILNKAEKLAAEPGFMAALKAQENPAERSRQAALAFDRFAAKDTGDAHADIVALLDAQGNLVAMAGVPTVVPKQWKNEKGEPLWPSINLVLGKRIIVSEVWDYLGKGMMKVGVAPVIDHDAPVPADDPDGVSIIGAVVVAYAQTSVDAQRDQSLLGTVVAYHEGGKIVATSFTKGMAEEDTAKQAALSQIIASHKLSDREPARITLEGVDYFALSVALTRTASKKLTDELPPVTAGAVVLAPISDANSIAAKVKFLIVLVGVGSIVLALLGIYVVHRRLIVQVDAVEQGVTDIINGNVDRTFRPVGAELDGLANGLNVMLARLLGRPEPGEEELDDEGNPIVPGRVEFDESEGGAPTGSSSDPDLAALVAEAEPDYYKRVYTEYLAARRGVGQPDEVSFENFIAKLKVNEGKLKARYSCKALRFRVVTADGKVILKPVPIYA